MEESKNEWKKNYNEEERARKLREQEYAKIVKASRGPKMKPIMSGKVIKGLRFIAENQGLNQKDLIEGLLALGCDFLLEDVNKQFPKISQLNEAMKKGEIGCGAAVIANVRDFEDSRTFCNEHLLSVDDDSSIYHFIRVVTGDNSYTKEFVDELNKRKVEAVENNRQL